MMGKYKWWKHRRINNFNQNSLFVAGEGLTVRTDAVGAYTISVDQEGRLQTAADIMIDDVSISNALGALDEAQSTTTPRLDTMQADMNDMESRIAQLERDMEQQERIVESYRQLFDGILCHSWQGEWESGRRLAEYINRFEENQ
jgi:hypothetical protein